MHITKKAVWYCTFWCAVLMFGLLTVATAASPSPVAGTWEGDMVIASKPYRMVWHFVQSSDGRLVGTFDSPDSGVSGFALDSVSFDGATLVCEVFAYKGRYEGKLQSDGKTIVGTWSQAGLPNPLPHTMTFVSSATQAESKRPQEPTRPYPYADEEVSYENSKAGIKIAGTLTKPKTGGPFAVALLIQGSDRTNRNEEGSGTKHKAFLVLADDLTRRGIAVLRFDKRGVGATTGSFESAGLTDFVDDVLAGVAYLKSRKDIDPRRIGVIGHSEGGLIAPLAATRSADIAFVVMMAGPGLPYFAHAQLQSDRILEVSGVSEPARKFLGTMTRERIEIARRESNNQIAMTQLAALWEMKKSEAAASSMSASDKALIASMDASMQGQANVMLTNMNRDKLNYDPTPTLRLVRCPVLAINGELDVFTLSKPNLAAIDSALKAGGNKDYTVMELPGINHFFQATKPGRIVELSSEETLNPAALNVIGTWVMQHSTR